MDLSSLSFSGLLIFGLAAVLKEQILICFKVATVFVKSFFWGREYNLDGDESTADWCEGYNTGKGEWGLIKILRYSIFHVRTEMRDLNGELHQRDIPILEWIATRTNRRHVSKQQRDAIKSANNDWPTLDISDYELLPVVTNCNGNEEVTEQVKRLADVVDGLLNAVATKTDTEEIKNLVGIKKELEAARADLEDWKKKRPVELGRVKASVTRVNERLKELESQVSNINKKKPTDKETSPAKKKG
jgi:hypothetical protein